MLLLNNHSMNPIMNVGSRKYIDRSPIRTEHEDDLGIRRRNVMSHNIEQALLPLFVNGLDINQMYILTDPEVQTTVLDHTLSSFREHPPATNMVTWLRVFTPQAIAWGNSYMEDNDEYIRLSDDIHELFNKTCKDAREREAHIGLFDALGYETCVYYNEEKKVIVQFVTTQDYRQLSDVFLLIGTMPLFIPELKEKLTPEEEDYFKELVRRSQIKRITNMNAEERFNTMVLTRKYQDTINEQAFAIAVETVIRRQLDRAEQNLYNIDSQIRNLLSTYESELRRQRDAQREILFISDSAAAVKEKLLNLPQLACVVGPIRATNGGRTLSVDVTAPVDNYNPEEAEHILKRYMEREDYSEGVLNTMYKIFVEQKYTMHCVHTFHLSPSEERINLSGSIDNNTYSRLQMMPNPHLQFFSCFGTYESQIKKAHFDQDYELTITIAAASVSNLNFADSAVMSRFLGYLDVNNGGIGDIRAFEDANGERWTFRELLEGADELDIDFVDTDEATPVTVEAGVEDIPTIELEEY